jgi:hypothetical protein
MGDDNESVKDVPPHQEPQAEGDSACSASDTNNAAAMKGAAQSNGTIKGVPVSEEEKAQLDLLRSVFNTKSALDRVDAYGKWLFASATVVGSLGAGLSNAAFSKLRGLGTIFFAASILALGASLVCASLSLAPQWVKVQLDVLKSMQDAVQEQFEKRQRFLTMASIFFALALAFAALSPVGSLFHSQSVPALHYSIDDKGAFEAGLTGTYLSPGAFVELRLNGKKSGSANTELPKTAAIVGTDGSATLTLKAAGMDATNVTSLDVIGCIREQGDTQCAKEYLLHVR